jgi:hypothetical protein
MRGASAARGAIPWHEGERQASIAPTNRYPTALRRCERIAPYLLSILLHGLLFIGLVVIPTTEAARPPAETSVDILSAEQFNQIVTAANARDHPAEKQIEKNQGRAPPAEMGALSAPERPVPDPAAREGVGIWRRATQILSEAALADPRHRKMAARLELLETNTRLEQLCNLEAILQISQKEARFRPESVIAYAMLATRSDGNFIIADGAAFHSDGQWYNLAFKCRISPRQQRVAAFEFATGAAIPERDWASHDLPRQMTAGDD